jgi:hypothetical protein
MICGMLGYSTEERFDIVEGSVECRSGCPSPGGTTAKIEASEKSLVVLSDLEMVIFTRHV